MEYSTELKSAIKKLRNKKLTGYMEDNVGIPTGMLLTMMCNKLSIKPEDIKTKSIKELLTMANKLEAITNVVKLWQKEYEKQYCK